jgi:hypothetical protein
MLFPRDARLSHLNELSFVQEVPAHGNDRLSDVNSAANDGALTVESDEPNRLVRYG